MSHTPKTSPNPSMISLGDIPAGLAPQTDSPWVFIVVLDDKTAEYDDGKTCGAFDPAAFRQMAGRAAGVIVNTDILFTLGLDVPEGVQITDEEQPTHGLLVNLFQGQVFVAAVPVAYRLLDNGND